MWGKKKKDRKSLSNAKSEFNGRGKLVMIRLGEGPEKVVDSPLSNKK